jgi:hypothetical protein
VHGCRQDRGQPDDGRAGKGVDQVVVAGGQHDDGRQQRIDHAEPPDDCAGGVPREQEARPHRPADVQ